MKKLFAVVTMAVVAAAGAVFAGPSKRVSNDEVERVIDARLHQMLVKLNQSKR
ncbi:MAG: hypothetical protein JNJ54_12375 [Myxococcaceae bacterium]|nr:hypothetical protein [Myxococcaceae bacterium]